MLTPESLDELGEDTGKKYRQHFADDARAKWERSHREEAKDFGESMIAPLTKGHVAWMKSERMPRYFDCSYDPGNWNAGLVYTQVVTAWIDNTQDKQACHDLYGDWLEHAGKKDAKNLLANAL
jgi:hypothetical protein